MKRVTSEEQTVTYLINHAREEIELSRCIIEQDEDGTKLYTLTILDHLYEDDKQNLIDVEGMSELELRELIVKIIRDDSQLDTNPAKVVMAVSLLCVLDGTIKY